MKSLQSKDNLIWLDLEMTGLDPEKERIIEIATLITDSQPLFSFLFFSFLGRDQAPKTLFRTLGTQH